MRLAAVNPNANSLYDFWGKAVQPYDNSVIVDLAVQWSRAIRTDHVPHPLVQQ